MKKLHFIFSRDLFLTACFELIVDLSIGFYLPLYKRQSHSYSGIYKVIIVSHYNVIMVKYIWFTVWLDTY